MEKFQQKIWNFYQKNKRDFVWRQDITPYKVFVSEVMLQQTQTARVIPKFEQWIKLFVDFASLADASTHQVLKAWQGLGYNRRGLALHNSAKKIMHDFDGHLPDEPHLLQMLPGIGPNTAGSICAFAFNKPVVFIETNIRTVFLHEFFQDQSDISDKQLLPFIEQTMDQHSARDWYYALMDYGVYLKKEMRVNNKQSKHYAVQSKFTGSRRQVRGAIIRILSKTKVVSWDELFDLVRQELPENKHDINQIMQELIREGMIKEQNEDLLL